VAIWSKELRGRARRPSDATRFKLRSFKTENPGLTWKLTIADSVKRVY